ncbi:polysaccharide biosynthesis/export family protein [Roseibium sp.]|uniref:polysaccharide biosynthesis/export family protein n=1 Tax=Roseibium sp. TaxID=1936156 RepID=UPI003B50D97A
MRSEYFKVLLFAQMVLLAGCDTLPRSGPDDSAIVKQASAVVAEDPGAAQQVAINYAFLDLSSNMLRYIDGPGMGSFTTFGGGRGGAPEIFVGVGDVVRVTVFESSAGGLFIPADAGSRPGNFVNLPDQTVEKNGFINVPYAGLIKANGRSLQQIAAEIQAKIENRAIEPQVVVSFVDRVATTASVTGEVNSPGRFEINENGDRILDIIARAGGNSNPGYESYITLQRAGRTARVYFNSIAENPAENIYVAPGDSIIVDQEQRAFQAFGASGLSGEFKFDQEQLTLSQGVGKAGGLLDDQADPGQVFIYRMETRSTLEKIGLDMSTFDSRDQKIPTIYRTSFRDPSGFFVSQRFELRDKDVIYISNADSVELIKFLDVLNSVTSTVSGVSTDARLTRNNAVSLSKGLNVDLVD